MIKELKMISGTREELETYFIFVKKDFTILDSKLPISFAWGLISKQFGDFKAQYNAIISSDINSEYKPFPIFYLKQQLDNLPNDPISIALSLEITWCKVLPDPEKISSLNKAF